MSSPIVKETHEVNWGSISFYQGQCNVHCNVKRIIETKAYLIKVSGSCNITITSPGMPGYVGHIGAVESSLKPEFNKWFSRCRRFNNRDALLNIARKQINKKLIRKLVAKERKAIKVQVALKNKHLKQFSQQSDKLLKEYNGTKAKRGN